MVRAKDIPEIISSTSAIVLDAHPSASVQLRTARDVRGDDDLTDAALARGIPDDHPALGMLRRVDSLVKSSPKRVPKIDKVLYLWGDRSGRPFSSYMDRG